MVDTRYLQCPACRRLLRTWYQVGASEVMCPCCGAEVNVESQIAETRPEPGLISRFADFLAVALRLQFLTGH